ncbi:MAG: hypothetical protein ACMXYB_04815 [Candidatus Woesearchaeota archaeon]
MRYKVLNDERKFEILTGRPVDTTKLLNRDERFLGVADEAQRRSEMWDYNIANVYENYIDCPYDMAVFPRNNFEEFAIVLGSKDLKNINSDTVLRSGLIVLPNSQREFEGDFTKWFLKEDIIRNKPLSFDEYMEHQGWGTILRDPRIPGMPQEIASHPNFKEHYGKQVWEKSGLKLKTDAAMPFYIFQDSPRSFTGGGQLCLGGINELSSVYPYALGGIFHFKGKQLAVSTKNHNPKWSPKKSTLEEKLK